MLLLLLNMVFSPPITKVGVPLMVRVMDASIMAHIHNLEVPIILLTIFEKGLEGHHNMTLLILRTINSSYLH